MSTSAAGRESGVTRWTDVQWWLALAAAPLFCAGLAVSNQPVAGPYWISMQPLQFLLLALVYPVLEELVFRGLVQDSLSRRLQAWPNAPLSKANLLASLLFALLHGFSHPPLWAAAVFIPSLAFGHFRERHQGLTSPIMLHAFYNSCYYAVFGVALTS